MSKSKFPIVGEEIAEHVSDLMKHRGMDPAKAQEEGNQIAELMLTVYAGEKLTFPSSSPVLVDRAHRDAQIVRDFDGKNAPVLAKRWGLSRSRIWQIVRANRER